MNHWLQKIETSDKLVIIEIGAGTAVPTVRMTSEAILRNYNSELIRINPRDYNVPQNSIPISLGSKNAVEKVYKLINTF